MCGIVGYVGKQKAISITARGNERLEYRGYDSAGVLPAAGWETRSGQKGGSRREPGQEAAKHRFNGTTGIGHTRWATHGGVTDATRIRTSARRASSRLSTTG